MINWLRSHQPPAAAPAQTLNSQTLPRYTDKEARTWHLLDVKPSASVPGFIEARRVEDGKPVHVHGSDVQS
ncbi:MAG: hypothetical protein ACTHLW_14355 [Verrucomicrobiota bacterium]